MSEREAFESLIADYKYSVWTVRFGACHIQKRNDRCEICAEIIKGRIVERVP